MTELKWYEESTVHKLYLSAILDLYDRRIVSYVLSDRNGNPLVYKTFDKAVRLFVKRNFSRDGKNQAEKPRGRLKAVFGGR